MEQLYLEKRIHAGRCTTFDIFWPENAYWKRRITIQIWICLVLQPSFFVSQNEIGSGNDTAITMMKKRRKKSLANKQLDEQYEKSEETSRIFVGDGVIDTTKYFPYLGLYTSYHLRGNFDIDRRIAEANKLMGKYFEALLEQCSCEYF